MTVNPPMQFHSTILGIESSCDDTSSAIIKNGEIKANIISSQDVHRKYGGVVPELASRAHQAHIIPVIEETLKESKTAIETIDAIAVTQGPGLMGSLIVGFNTAKGLSLAMNKPLIGVNHLQAHVAALYIENEVEFPMICLLVSGGHTQLLYVENHFSYKIIGNTIDDAIGEAFDKGAKLLGLGYPGGPQISKLAAEGEIKFKFPDAQTKDLDFSFSGIKTSLLYFLKREAEKDSDFVKNNLTDICASYQHALIEMSNKRLLKAIKQYRPKSISLVGGVSANSLLRKSTQNIGLKYNLNVYIPSIQYCTDNAGMIAMAGSLLFEKGEFLSLDALPFTRT